MGARKKSEVTIDAFKQNTTGVSAVCSPFRIGGVSFQFCASPELVWLQAPPYAAFRSGDGSAAGITLRLRRLDRRSLRGPVPERSAWPERAQAENEYVSGKLLSAPPVRRWLAQARPARIALHDSWLAGLDFATRTGDFFYLTRRWVETRSNSGAEGVTCIHYLKTGLPLAQPLAIPPRLPLGFGLDGPEALPLLRASQVQRWLRACRPTWPDLLIWGNSETLHVLNEASGNQDIFCYPDGNLTDATAISFIRRLTAVYFPLFGKVQIHCSGVVRHGPGGAPSAALFLARSGGGKTTTARLNQGGTLLSDDQVVVERAAGRFVAHATPFARLPVTAAQAPIAALILLEKAQTFSLRPCPPTDVALHLHNDHAAYTRWLPVALKKQVFDFFCDLAYTLPTYRMSFSKDFIDWDAVDAALGVA